MIKTQQQAINRLIEWRGKFVNELLEQVEVERVHYEKSKQFECAKNAQTLQQLKPEIYKTISGWMISKEPREFMEDKWGFLIVSHYWNKYNDGTECQYIDTTPLDQRVDDIHDWAYVKDQTIFEYATYLDKLGLPNISVVAPSYVLDQDGDFIETIEVAPGVNRVSTNAILEGSMGHIFRKQMRVDGKFHPLLVEKLGL